jgi:heptosyltransferase-2
MARRLAARRYDRAYVLPNSFKSAIVPFLAGIRQRIGWRGEARHLLLNVLHDDRDAGTQRPPMVEHYAQLAMPPGRPLPGPLPNPALRVDAARTRETLDRLSLADGPLVVMAPGAEYGPAKRWPPRHFAALANMVADEWPEASIALLGSAKERALATEIAALSGLSLRNLCGETSLDEAIALVSHAAGIVSNDSGLMHVAAALGRPQVALFGSTDPRHTAPRSARARVQWLHLECSPCFARECPLGHHACLNDLAPAGAFSALRQTMRIETATRR